MIGDRMVGGLSKGLVNSWNFNIMPPSSFDDLCAGEVVSLQVVSVDS